MKLFKKSILTLLTIIIMPYVAMEESVPTTVASTQSPTTVTSIQSTTTVTSTQSPTTINSTHLPTIVTSTTATTTGAATIAPQPTTGTQPKIDTAKTTLSTMLTVPSKRPPITLPPVPHTCITCTGDSTPDTCEYQYEETQCNPPNNYCMNIVTNSISGTRTMERKCASFDDCYSNWWQGSSDEELCQTYTPDKSLTANFQCSFCCIENRCNENIKPPKETLYQDN